MYLYVSVFPFSYLRKICPKLYPYVFLRINTFSLCATSNAFGIFSHSLSCCMRCFFKKHFHLLKLCGSLCLLTISSFCKSILLFYHYIVSPVNYKFGNLSLRNISPFFLVIFSFFALNISAGFFASLFCFRFSFTFN